MTKIKGKSGQKAAFAAVLGVLKQPLTAFEVLAILLSNLDETILRGCFKTPDGRKVTSFERMPQLFFRQEPRLLPKK